MIDEEIRIAELQLKRHKINDKKNYRAALAYLDKMSLKQHHTDKEFNEWDIAILIVRNYRKKHYLEWLKQ